VQTTSSRFRCRQEALTAVGRWLPGGSGSAPSGPVLMPTGLLAEVAVILLKIYRDISKRSSRYQVLVAERSFS
jgi:hypothetical protein